MAFVKWLPDFEIGISLIDQQHQNLVKFLNQLHEAISFGKSNELIGNLLEGMIDYTIEHFSTEENFFSQYNYPDKEKHISEHNSLVAQVIQLQERLQQGDIVISYDILLFLQNWLTEHILISDRRFGEFYQWGKEKSSN